MKNISAFERINKMDMSYLLDPEFEGADETDINYEANKDVADLQLNQLKAFKNHPFRVDTESEKFQELLDSVKEYGVIQPILVRRSGNEYEIISGHCRVEAARLAGMETIPAKIVDIDDFMATIFMTHSNIYGRDDILISEKAKAYRMCLDEQKKAGVNRGETAEYVGAGKDSKRQVQRYVRLSYLNDELLAFVDKGRLSVQIGTELAFLDGDSQNALCTYINDTNQVPNLDQAKILRETNKMEDKSLSYEKIISLLVTAPKPKVQNKVTFKTKELAGYFDEGTSAEKMTDIIRRLLEKYSSGELVLEED